MHLRTRPLRGCSRCPKTLLIFTEIHISYEAIREWSLKFGQIYANELRRKRPRPGDKWHLDEMFIKINGKEHYLWRAVDQDGNVLDILVQSRRNKKAAKRFTRRAVERITLDVPTKCKRVGLRLTCR